MKPVVNIVVAGVAALFGGVAMAQDDPLLRPIAPDYAQRWLGEEAPVRIHGRTYLVGFSGLNVVLIDTGDGLVLIDGALPQAVASIEAHVRQLGFRVEDIKAILSTEPHFDHAGGLAALSRDTGAPVIASPEAAEVLRRGRSGKDDPQAAWLAEFPPVERVQVIRDGETLRFGDTVITAHATPGHTPGSMSWGWRSCGADGCADILFGSSLNPLAAEDYAFSEPEHEMALTAFRGTFARLRTVPCDILLTAHPDQSGGEVKLEQYRREPSPNPFIDPQACRTYADKYEALLEVRLAEERTASRQ